VELTCDTTRLWQSPAGGEVELGGLVRSSAEPVRVVVHAAGMVRAGATLGPLPPEARAAPRRWSVVLPANVLRGAGVAIRISASDRAGAAAGLRLDVPLPVPPETPWSIDEYRDALRAGRHLLVCHRPTFDGRAVVGDVLSVEGWAHAPAGIEAIQGQLDADPAVSAFSPLATPWLIGDVGDWPDLGSAGFRLIIDTATGPRGVRRLSISSRAGDGSLVTWGTRVRVDPDLAYRRHLVQRGRRAYRSLPHGALTSPHLLVWPLSPSETLTRSLAAQSYPWWTVAEPDEVSVQLGLHAAAAADTGLTIFVAAEAELRAGTLHAVAAAANHATHEQAFFADHDRYDGDGRRHEPWHKPAWSPELMLAMDQVGPLLAIRPSAARALLATGEQMTSLYDLAVMLIDLEIPVGHVDCVAATLCAGATLTDQTDARAAIDRLARRRHRTVVVRELDGQRRRVSWPAPDQPLVTIVIPTTGRGNMILRCLQSIADRSTYPQLEVVVVDTSRRGLDLEPAFHRDRAVRSISCAGPFNYSTTCNLGAANANGDVLLFLNDDTEVQSPDWIERMLDHALMRGVGPVGAKLLYADRRIQHAGMILTLPDGAAHNLLVGLPAEGTTGSLGVARNCSAVTGACLMLARSRFETLHGFDEAFSLEYGEVDLCLRSLEAGQRVVWTPHAVIIHHESATRGSQTSDADLLLFRRRWAAKFRSGDPYYPAAFDRAGMFAYA
jgi:O-antigen biosynthesis protein